MKGHQIRTLEKHGRDAEMTSEWDSDFITGCGKPSTVESSQGAKYLTPRLGQGKNTTAPSREYIRSNLWSMREKTSLGITRPQSRGAPRNWRTVMVDAFESPWFTAQDILIRRSGGVHKATRCAIHSWGMGVPPKKPRTQARL